MGFFDRNDDDPNLVAARADAESALPEGWKLAEEDREGFLLVGTTTIALDVGQPRAAPNGELELAVACDKASAYIALGRRLRGDLETTDGWAPPLQYVDRHWPEHHWREAEPPRERSGGEGRSLKRPPCSPVRVGRCLRLPVVVLSG